jgi:drug/metabolite transporter (DMT)-like permease
MFAEKSGINPGIISSIFSSTCVFTIIIFYFMYGQKLSIFDFIGIFFIVGSVVFISIGGGESGDEEESTRRLLAGPGPKKAGGVKLSPEEANMYLYFGVIAALCAGFVLSVNSVSLLYCGHVGCRIDQSNFDGNFIMFCIFFPMYLIIEYNSPGTYTARDLFSGSMDIITITIGVIAQGKGLAIGNGGPIQALENQKVVVVTIVTAIVYQNMPTVLQICGLVSGLVGVMFIVFQKQKGGEEGEDGKKAPELVH